MKVNMSVSPPELRFAWRENSLEREEVVTVVTLPLQHLLAQLLILEALGVAVDVDEPPLAVGDEVVVLVEDVSQLPKHQLQKLRLQ